MELQSTGFSAEMVIFISVEIFLKRKSSIQDASKANGLHSLLKNETECENVQNVEYFICNDDAKNMWWFTTGAICGLWVCKYDIDFGERKYHSTKSSVSFLFQTQGQCQRDKLLKIKSKVKDLRFRFVLFCLYLFDFTLFYHCSETIILLKYFFRVFDTKFFTRVSGDERMKW